MAKLPARKRKKTITPSGVRGKSAAEHQVEAKFEALMESAPDAIVMVDGVGKIVLANTQAEKMFGYKRHELLGQRVEVLLPDRVRAQHIQHRDHYYSEPYTRPMGAGLNLAGLRKDGSEFPVEISLSSLQTDEGTLVTSIIRDITDRRRVENELQRLNHELERRVLERTAELKEEHDRVQKYLDVAGVMIVVIDPSRQVTLINKKGCEVLGYEEKEIIGKDWFCAFIPERVREQAQGIFERLMTGQTQGIDYFDSPILNRAGEERTIAWHHTILRDESGRILATLSSGEDITHRIELERQIVRSERLVAFGEMAASLAHEFNNPLGIIMGFAQDLLTEVDPSDSKHASLRIIEEEARRCKKIMRDLLEFGRPTPAQFSHVDIREAIRKSVDLVANQLQKAAVQPTLRLDKDLPKVWADAQQLQQVLVNLVFNAMEAMPGGGKLMIRAGLRPTGRGDGGSPESEGRPGVEISISDTGCGIDLGDLDMIFRPFYSKKKRKGIGLGLSICESIIRAHGGGISVQSEPGNGAIFYLYFPIERRKEARSIPS